MSTKHSNASAPYQRRTLALRGTVSRVEVQLDHPSQLAIAYARQWLKAGPGGMGLDVLASGVIRRSLARYMQHLSDSTTDPQQEARAVRSCCSAHTVNAEDRQTAQERLQAHIEGALLPPYRDVLHGPDSASQTAAINTRVDALLDQMGVKR